MKILVLDPMDYGSLGSSYSRAFNSLGHDVTHLDPFALLNRMRSWQMRPLRRAFERQIISRFNRDWLDDLSSIDADLVWIGKGAWAIPWLWKSYKERKPKAKLVCYSPDDPITAFSRGGYRPWVSEAIPYFDLFCTYKEELVPTLKKRGANTVAVVPFAWDPHLHPRHKAQEFETDIIFVGNGDKYREMWLTHLLEQEWTESLNIKVFGIWKNVSSKALRERLTHQQRTGTDMARLLARSRVSINILRIQNEGSHNMRTFETAGCGGVNASQYSEQQASIFPENSAAYYFRSMDEMGPIIREAVFDVERNLEIRQNAFRIAQKETYARRAVQILEEAL